MKKLAGWLERRFKALFVVVLRFLLIRNSTVSLPPSSSAKSFLLLRPDRLGDFLLAVPALRALEKGVGKGGHFTLVVGERAEEVARLFFPRFTLLVFKKGFFSRLSLYFRLWKSRFDAVVDLHSYPFSVTSAFLSALPQSLHRVGFMEKQNPHPLSSKVFNQAVLLEEGGTHEAEKNSMLLRNFLGKKRSTLSPLAISVPPETRQRVLYFYREAGIGKGDFVVGIHPTLLKEDNRWSQENYLAFIKGLQKVAPVKVVVVWGKGEEAALSEFQTKYEGMERIWALPVRDLLFLMEAARRFDLFVCNDSGLMHALALVTNVFAVFGPSDPAQWRPLAAKRLEIFRAPDHRCDSVKSATVVTAVKKIFLRGKRWK